MIFTTLDYETVVRALKCMDEKQLLELFHDIDDAAVVERIANLALQFITGIE